MSTTPAPPARNRIFINYRRQDSEVEVGRLAADLRRVFGADQVFQDVASIDPGVDFEDALRQGLQTCAAVLVVIGPQWLATKDERGRRRLDVADDWVRREVAESLNDKAVRVFPVLVGNARMPGADELPPDIRALARRQAYPVTTRHWPKDVDELVGFLKRSPGLVVAPAAAPLPQSVVAPSRAASGFHVGSADTGDLPQAIASPRAGGSDAEQKAPGSNPGSAATTHIVAPDKSRRFLLPVVGLGAVALVAVGIYLSGVFEGAAPSTRVDAVNKQPANVVQAPAAIVAKAQTAQTALKPGESFRDCDACPEMVVIPPSSFTMGSPDNEAGRSPDEGPQHRVTITRAFAAGKYEVTFEQWDACVTEGGCQHKPDDANWGRGRQPVMRVSWNDAQEYVAWLSKKTGKAYRLLSEAEWEYAARGGTTTRYPWGDDPGIKLANFKDSGSQWSGKQAAPVGSFAANRYGLYDMSGNVWEWTLDCWNENYVGAPVDGKAWESGDCLRRVVRGGSWVFFPQLARVAVRGRLEPADRFSYLGFRLARTL